MAKDKYLSISLCQMEAIVFSILQIFFVTRAGLKIGLGAAFRPITHERKYLMDYNLRYQSLT